MNISYPKKCRYCGAEVVLIENSRIYGKRYGSGYVYLCTNNKCGAYVGTHKNNVHAPLGILANKELRILRRQAHLIFDSFWKNKKKSRSKCYSRLAQDMKIPINTCHFAYFDESQILKALGILNEWVEQRDKTKMKKAAN